MKLSFYGIRATREYKNLRRMGLDHQSAVRTIGIKRFAISKGRGSQARLKEARAQRAAQQLGITK